MPVQDVYKFTGEGDGRRLIAGRIEAGSVKAGDEVLFLPSNKRSKIKTIEVFNREGVSKVGAGYSTSFTLAEQIYVKPGELMCKRADEQPPCVSSLFKANIFWMDKTPLVAGKEYKLKLTSRNVPATIQKIDRVLNSSTLVASDKKTQVDRHEVAECVVETAKPIAFDTISNCQATGRFVLVDNFEIAGGGIILEALKDGAGCVGEKVDLREIKWERGEISQEDRTIKFKHKPRLILITGRRNEKKVDIAEKLEALLHKEGFAAYYIGIRNIIYGVDADIKSIERYRDEHIRRLAEVVHILLDAGLTVVATASDLNEDDIGNFKTILGGQEMLLANIGENDFIENILDLNIGTSDSPQCAAEKLYKHYLGFDKN